MLKNKNNKNLMLKNILSICLFFIFFSIINIASANEADMDKALKSDNELIEANQRLNDLYEGILLSLDYIDKKALQETSYKTAILITKGYEDKKTFQIEQREWIKKRNIAFEKNSDNSNAITLLKSLYKDRLEALSERFNALPAIPVEAMVKYPSLWGEFQEKRFMPEIKANFTLNNMPAFDALEKCIEGLESGRWVTTSYDNWVGTIRLDILAGIGFYKQKMNFAPQLIQDNHSFEQKLAPLIAWSYEGIWNRKSYQACKALYQPAVTQMDQYYSQNYGLTKFANQGKEILASYIAYRDSYENEIVHSPAFNAFREKIPSLEELKQTSTQFTAKDWNIALAMALLNHSPANIIEFLIASGADVNTSINDEYPLMRAVEQPEIVKILLQRGADVTKQTPYGKTALFYAIQYNQLNTVQLLIIAGADVNHPIKNLKEIENFAGGPYRLEKTAEFTPLVYSLRYASPEVTDYLKKHGALIGKARFEVIKNWVMQNPKITESELLPYKSPCEISAQSRKLPIEAGIIWNQADANKKCATLAKDNDVVWNGEWWTTVPNKMSVCVLVFN